MSDDVHIVAATEKETPIILHMIRGLAEFEKLSHYVIATEASLREQLFGATPAAEVCLLYVGDEPAGFAVYFHTFSTFTSRRGMYLEDLFVVPRWRARGFGRQLFAYVAKIGAERGCRTMKWAVLPGIRSSSSCSELRLLLRIACAAAATATAATLTSRASAATSAPAAV
jgi:GNAT superfamily N-acetyltransferase